MRSRDIAIVRLSSDGACEVIDPGTPEEEAIGDELFLGLVHAVARLAAERVAEAEPSADP